LLLWGLFYSVSYRAHFLQAGDVLLNARNFGSV